LTGRQILLNFLTFQYHQKTTFMSKIHKFLSGSGFIFWESIRGSKISWIRNTDKEREVIITSYLSNSYQAGLAQSGFGSGSTKSLNPDPMRSGSRSTKSLNPDPIRIRIRIQVRIWIRIHSPAPKYTIQYCFVSCFVDTCLTYVFDVHICFIYGR
jgi:hypothetical protein